VKLIIIAALEKRDLAKAQLQEAQKRAKEIKNKEFLLNKKKLCIKQAEEDANRVIQGKQDTIRLQQQKQLNKFHNKLYH
jgi:hypothetical protein